MLLLSSSVSPASCQATEIKKKKSVWQGHTYTRCQKVCVCVSPSYDQECKHTHCRHKVAEGRAEDDDVIQEVDTMK